MQNGGRISLRWLTYIVNSVHKTKLSCNTPTDAAPQLPKTATLPRQVEEPLSPLGVIDCSPALSLKPWSPCRHLSFSPVINIQSPSASRDSIITRRDFTKLVSNIYFSWYENMHCCLFATLYWPYRLRGGSVSEISVASWITLFLVIISLFSYEKRLAQNLNWSRSR